MANRVVRCPKCSYEQQGGVECESCGVIFEKYERYQQRQQDLKQRQSASRGKGTSPLLQVLLVALLVAASAGTTWFMMKPDATGGRGKVEITEPEDIRQEEIEVTSGVTEETVTTIAAASGSEPVSQTGFIEQARRATVSIETPWGTGSGFFISENFIVTNRHVVELDQEKVAEFRRKVEALGELIELEREKIRKMKKDYSALPKGPTREQLRILIGESKRELAKVVPKFDDASRKLEKMEEDADPSGVKVIMADGSEHSADFLLLSDNFDLALMSISVPEHPHLKRAPGTYRIRQGDRVYTIGSPVGLRNTVTAGVFSGLRKRAEDGSVLIQTDAPINPGNSGGPLIDEKGYVRGVNTMILMDTEGIGFAIPIEKVFEDFGASIY